MLGAFRSVERQLRLRECLWQTRTRHVADDLSEAIDFLCLIEWPLTAFAGGNRKASAVRLARDCHLLLKFRVLLRFRVRHIQVSGPTGSGCASHVCIDNGDYW